MSQMQDTLRAADALVGAGGAHDWAAVVLLQQFCGGLGQAIAHDLRRGRRGEASRAIAEALEQVAA